MKGIARASKSVVQKRRYSQTAVKMQRQRQAYRACLDASKDIDDKEKLQKCIDACTDSSAYLCDADDSY